MWTDRGFYGVRAVQIEALQSPHVCGVKSGATRSDRKTGGVINNQFDRFLE